MLSLRSVLASCGLKRTVHLTCCAPCRKQSIEIIVALKKLGETLTPAEKAFLKQHDDALAMFESADQAIDASVVAGAVSGAAAQ